MTNPTVQMYIDIYKCALYNNSSFVFHQPFYNESLKTVLHPDLGFALAPQELDHIA
jgi:hypothetical protein